MTGPQPPAPLLKAFLVCDQIIQDSQTGKKSLIGVFHELRAELFPAVHPVLWIYANLTDAHGRYAFQIRFVDVERNQILGSGVPPPIEIPGPLPTTELSALLRNVNLPRPGTYEFQLVANGNLIATKAVRAIQVKPPTSGKPSETPELPGETPPPVP